MLMPAERTVNFTHLFLTDPFLKSRFQSKSVKKFSGNTKHRKMKVAIALTKNRLLPWAFGFAIYFLLNGLLSQLKLKARILMNTRKFFAVVLLPVTIRSLFKQIIGMCQCRMKYSSVAHQFMITLAIFPGLVVQWIV